jgi:ribosome biogenesis GTPase
MRARTLHHIGRPARRAVSDDKLSDRQQARIEARRAARLAPWLDGADADAPDAGERGGQRGVVVSHLRREIELLTADGDTTRCFLRATVPAVVTGDAVLFERETDEAARGVVVARLPRASLLARHTARGLRPVCANLDLLLVTIAPAPAPHADLVDRYLLAAHLDDLDVAIVVNKADTLEGTTRAELDALLEPRRHLGPTVRVPVVEVSAHSGAGLDELRALVEGRTAAFVGQSGVGKSSLINALAPGAGAETGALSGRRNRGRGRGRHTTSTTRLYRTGASVIVDSPGIREFAPDVPDEAALVGGFPEIADAAAACRFSDCRHEVEPDCAVRAAVAEGRIAASRVASMHQLRAELLGPAR